MCFYLMRIVLLLDAYNVIIFFRFFLYKFRAKPCLLRIFVYILCLAVRCSRLPPRIAHFSPFFFAFLFFFYYRRLPNAASPSSVSPALYAASPSSVSPALYAAPPARCSMRVWLLHAVLFSRISPRIIHFPLWWHICRQ